MADQLKSKNLSILYILFLLIVGLLPTFAGNLLTGIQDKTYQLWGSAIGYKALLNICWLLIASILALIVFLQMNIKSSSGQTSNEAKPNAELGPAQSTKMKKKPLPYRFEFDVINLKAFEVTVFIKRWWLPNLHFPGVEEFLRAIELSDVRCGQCHSDFFTQDPHQAFPKLVCTNQDCSNKEIFYGNDLSQFLAVEKAKYFGEIRNNQDKYWKQYQAIYNKLTNNEPDQYVDP